MNYVCLMFVGFLMSFQVKAHDFFFAFAEIQYNQTSKKLEISIEATAHDVEYALKTQGITFKKHLENETKNNTFKKVFERYLQAEFQLYLTEKQIALQLIGFEIMPDGQLFAYLESESFDLKGEFSMDFHLLMNEFPQQQNKVIFTAFGKTMHAVFLNTKTRNIFNF